MYRIDRSRSTPGIRPGVTDRPTVIDFARCAIYVCGPRAHILHIPAHAVPVGISDTAPRLRSRYAPECAQSAPGPLEKLRALLATASAGERPESGCSAQCSAAGAADLELWVGGFQPEPQ